eukprot:jgi/Mesvir1/23039/Mv20912-RA.1
MSYRPQDCQHFSLATLRKKWKVGLCDHYTMEMAERHGKVQPRKRMPAKDRTPARSRDPGPARAEAVLAYPLTPVETEAAGGANKRSHIEMEAGMKKDPDDPYNISLRLALLKLPQPPALATQVPKKVAHGTGAYRSKASLRR